MQTYRRLTDERFIESFQRRISLLSLTHIISIPNSENLSRVFLSFFSFSQQLLRVNLFDSGGYIRSIARCQAFVKSYSEYIRSFVYTTFCMSVLHDSCITLRTYLEGVGVRAVARENN